MKMPWSKSAPESASSDVDEPAATTTPSAEPTPVRRDPTAPKGRPTPKRNEAARRRGPVPPPPATGKEARQRMRERAKERKAAGLPEQRAMTAREERIMARDAGPERALARNIVDSRRSFGPIFMPFAMVSLVMYFSGIGTKYPAAYAYASWAYVLILVAIIVESVWLGRRINREVRERYPKSTIKPLSLGYYGAVRNLMFRRMRYPKPVVEIGEEY